MTITPVTAMPYAAASASDVLKISTISTTPTASMTLTRGT